MSPAQDPHDDLGPGDGSLDAAQPGLDCRALPARLEALEQACGDRASAAEAGRLHAHVVGCAACNARHGARLAALRGVCALRSRDVPAGTLDDLRTRVLASVRAGGSGGMSPAFLDAPASLARWRRLALAASVLLAVGAGFAASGRLELKATPGAHDRDLRDTYLPRLVRGYTLDDDDTVQPVLLPGQGVSGFYGPQERMLREIPARRGSPASGSDD